MFVVCIALIFLFGAGGGKGLDVGIRVCFSSLYVVLCLSFDADFYTLSTAESIKIRLYILTDIISLNDISAKSYSSELSRDLVWKP